MSAAGWLLWLVSLGVIVILLWIDWSRRYREAPGARKATLFILILLLVIGLAVIAVDRLGTHETMAAAPPPFPLGTVGLLFVVMIFGMMAEYFYSHGFGKIDWSGFAKPFFASPIVFLPLVAANERAMTGLEVFEMGDLMLFLVAFQNGFFWKMVFERQQQQAAET